MSRPKVHRLPTRAVESRRRQAMSVVLSYSSAARFVFSLSSLALIVALAAMLVSRFGPLGRNIQETVSVSAVAVSDAMASVPSAQDKTIVLTGEDGARIVGRLAKMAAAQQSADSGIISEVDKRRGQELLSILNRTN